MVSEVLACLRCRRSDGDERRQEEQKIYIDGTLGTAGHTIAVLQSDEKSCVVAFDRDAESVQWARRRLEDEGLVQRVALVQSDFRFAPQALQKLDKACAGESTLSAQATNLENLEADATLEVLFVGEEFPKRQLIGNIHGALIDAGMSMFQVAWGERGLSFQNDAPLDMRYDRRRGVSAFDLVNQLSQNELEDLFFKFTDERWARRIAAVIAEYRRRQVIRTTSQLTSLIEAAIPAALRRHMRVHPATKVFAALRLAVNDEFWALEHGAWALCSVLAPSGRLVVLTYSSHEDRTVKRTFRRLAAKEYSSRQEAMALSTPPSASSKRPPLTISFAHNEFSLALPTDRDDLEPPEYLAPWLEGFGRKWRGEIVTPKPIGPGEEEIASNPLARSCKLRAIEKVEIDSTNPEQKRRA